MFCGHGSVDSVGSAYNDVVVACRCEWKSKTLGYDGVRYGLNVSTVSNLQGKPHTCPNSRLFRLPLLTPPACKKNKNKTVHSLCWFCCDCDVWVLLQSSLEEARQGDHKSSLLQKLLSEWPNVHNRNTYY